MLWRAHLAISSAIMAVNITACLRSGYVMVRLTAVIIAMKNRRFACKANMSRLQPNIRICIRMTKLRYLRNLARFLSLLKIKRGDRSRAQWAEMWGLLCPFLWGRIVRFVYMYNGKAGLCLCKFCQKSSAEKSKSTPCKHVGCFRWELSAIVSALVYFNYNIFLCFLVCKKLKKEFIRLWSTKNFLHDSEQHGQRHSGYCFT